MAPDSAERRAARMFVTPPRQSGGSSTSRGHSRPPVDVGLPTADLVVRSRNHDVAVTTLGDGPPVMLLHGWGGTATDMMPLAVAYAAAGFRAIVFDMPGHGRSTGRESSLVEFLHAIRAVKRALGSPEVIVGHSFGGAAAIFGITEIGLSVRAAVLVSPAPGPAYYVTRFARAVGLPSARTDGMVRKLVERVGRSLESLDALAAAQHARVPALVFHDPADREVPFEFSTKLTDAWPESRLVEAPSLGHKRILRDPTVIAAAVDFAMSVRHQPVVVQSGAL